MLHSIYLVMIRCHYPLPRHQLPPHFIRMLTLSTGSPLGFNSFFWTTPPLSLVGLWNPVSSCPTPCRWPPTPLGLWCPSAVGCYHGPPTWMSSHPPVPWHRSLLTPLCGPPPFSSGCRSSPSSTIHLGLFPQRHLMQHRFFILKSFVKFPAREIPSIHILPLMQRACLPNTQQWSVIILSDLH